MSNKTLDLIKQHEAKWVDLRFTDTKGKEQHVSFPAATVDEETFVSGKMFDGSSIAGWKGIEASDMILMPDPEPWSRPPTPPRTPQPLTPRSDAKRRICDGDSVPRCSARSGWCSVGDAARGDPTP